MNINQTQNQNAQCCVDYCTTSFSEGEQTIVNSYKCNSKKISSADVCSIQKQRKEAVVRNYSL